MYIGSLAKEPCNLKEPTNRSHHIVQFVHVLPSRHICKYPSMLVRNDAFVAKFTHYIYMSFLVHNGAAVANSNPMAELAATSGQVD